MRTFVSPASGLESLTRNLAHLSWHDGRSFFWVLAGHASAMASTFVLLFHTTISQISMIAPCPDNIFDAVEVYEDGESALARDAGFGAVYGSFDSAFVIRGCDPTEVPPLPDLDVAACQRERRAGHKALPQRTAAELDFFRSQGGLGSSDDAVCRDKGKNTKYHKQARAINRLYIRREKGSLSLHLADPLFQVGVENSEGVWCFDFDSIARALEGTLSFFWWGLLVHSLISELQAKQTSGADTSSFRGRIWDYTMDSGASAAAAAGYFKCCGFVVKIPAGTPQVFGLAAKMPVGYPKCSGFVVKIPVVKFRGFAVRSPVGYFKCCGFVVKIPAGSFLLLGPGRSRESAQWSENVYEDFESALARDAREALAQRSRQRAELLRMFFHSVEGRCEGCSHPFLIKAESASQGNLDVRFWNEAQELLQEQCKTHSRCADNQRELAQLREFEGS
ncbi:hypothetical protein AK812_SmicGene33873 [Symbiodinium microadriaticum]|uniref:Uncharacterized protein n=1 Tax=Symbiodinium microadriaticum TaxID=2951 RepID=A0A1Q9CQG2_SYMMI|nr:hypothetical protein AK812_SmicGene33873 [Symbiodinium microadriaticum]